MSISHLDNLFEELKTLRVEHRDLDGQIIAMSHNPFSNSLEIKRLKKRKLLLKQAIVKLESKLIPDLNA